MDQGRASGPGRDALVKLGQRLQLRQATSDSARDRTVAAVLEALQSGPWSSWLLVFDNAANPLDLQKYIPAARPGGQVIITVRQPNWPSYIVADSVEISPFTDAESASFLRRTVPSLAEEDRLPAVEDALRLEEALRLATTLGNLPIALGHAAAYLAETGQSVDEYLTRFTDNAHQLLSEQPTDGDLPAPVSGTWAMSITLLSPDAEHLFNLCSFFSPEPIAAELLLQSVDDTDAPPGLAEFLSSPPRFRAAATQLHRLSLARVDGAHDLIQVHRVVQAVTQGRLQSHRIETFRAYRAAADTLLASSNPGNPDQASATRSTTCRCSTSSPITGSCARGTPNCARSSSTRYGDCTCAAATSRRCGSARTPWTSGAVASANRTPRCSRCPSRSPSPCTWAATRRTRTS